MQTFFFPVNQRNLFFLSFSTRTICRFICSNMKRCCVCNRFHRFSNLNWFGLRIVHNRNGQRCDLGRSKWNKNNFANKVDINELLCFHFQTDWNCLFSHRNNIFFEQKRLSLFLNFKLNGETCGDDGSFIVIRYSIGHTYKLFDDTNCVSL